VGKQLIGLFAGLLAVGLVVTGCGGGGDSSTVTITKAEFVKKADAACKKGEERIQTDFRNYLKEHEELTEPTEEQFSKLVDVVLTANVEQELDEIRALGIPSGDDDQVEAFLEAREEGLEKAEAEPKAVVQGSESPFTKASKLAKEYGLKACGG
jgi:uncharacterized protein with von Willebrand factor type A (vWA) domain